jgi:hypothetical protein
MGDFDGARKKKYYRGYFFCTCYTNQKPDINGIIAVADGINHHAVPSRITNFDFMADRRRV